MANDGVNTNGHSCRLASSVLSPVIAIMLPLLRLLTDLGNAAFHMTGYQI